MKLEDLESLFMETPEWNEAFNWDLKKNWLYGYQYRLLSPETGKVLATASSFSDLSIKAKQILDQMFEESILGR